MPIQTATTGQLDNAQRIAIEQTRYTAEHNAPTVTLIEHTRLGKGEKSVTVPKVGQMIAKDLSDGVDLVESQDIGMTTVDLTTAEVGLKVILTDKLVRQQNEDMFRVVGRQMGDAMARKKDTDIIALFTAFNGGVTLGTAGNPMTMTAVAGLIAFAKSNRFPSPVSIVQHPNAVFDVVTSAALSPIDTGNNPIPHGYSEDLLRDFYRFTLNQVSVFEDGNIVPDGGDDGIGAVLSKHAATIIESVGFNTERERDASLRATEMVVTADYGVFELDDTYAAPATYDIAVVATG